MKIAIWGNGKFGNKICNQILEGDGINRIICIIDNKIKDYGYLHEDRIPIVNTEMFEKEYIKSADIVLVAITKFGSTLKTLKKWEGTVQSGVINPIVLEKDLDISKDILKDPYIIWGENLRRIFLPILENLQTNIVDECNLNCKGCSHFAQLFDKGSVYPIDKFEKDIKRISEKLFIEDFSMLGGEIFLLYDDLSEYIYCVKKYFPYTRISLYTNGLLIPNQSKELWRTIRKNEVVVNITNYPITDKILDRIESVLKDNTIKYTISQTKDSFGKNIDLKGDNNPYVAQTKCRQYTCQFLRKGKIHKCPFSALSNHFFEFYNIPLHFDEGIDLYDDSVDWDKVANSIRKIPIELCKYCGEEEQFEWGISNKPIKSEWVIK